MEWATVRAEAQRAKAAADKPRQKAAGQLFAALKREIASLGACRSGLGRAPAGRSTALLPVLERASLRKAILSP